MDALPGPPAIVALELRDARALLGDESLRWPSGRTVCLDLGLRERRGDPWVVSDLESRRAGSSATPRRTRRWRRKASSSSRRRCRSGRRRAPDGRRRASSALLDASFEGWRDRVTWRRRQVMDGRSGALDLPGTTWRDRPAIDRGDGVFLCGDQVAADGCLSEVSFASAISAGTSALEQIRQRALARAA